MAAAYALDKAIAAYWAGNTIESSLIWQTLWIIVGSIALNFLLLLFAGGVAGKHWL